MGDPPRPSCLVTTRWTSSAGTWMLIGRVESAKKRIWMVAPSTVPRMLVNTARAVYRDGKAAVPKKMAATKRPPRSRAVFRTRETGAKAQMTLPKGEGFVKQAILKKDERHDNSHRVARPDEDGRGDE